MNRFVKGYHICRWKLRDLWWYIRNFFMNIFIYRRVLGNTWNYYFTTLLYMMKFQLKHMLRGRANHLWLDTKSIPDIQRFIELLNNRLESNYFQRCSGANYQDYYNTYGETSQLQAYREEAKKLQEKEADEITKLFRKGFMDELDAPK